MSVFDADKQLADWARMLVALGAQEVVVACEDGSASVTLTAIMGRTEVDESWDEGQRQKWTRTMHAARPTITAGLGREVRNGDTFTVDSRTYRIERTATDGIEDCLVLLTGSCVGVTAAATGGSRRAGGGQ